MFADGYRQLRERIDAQERPADPAELVRQAARLFVAFAAEDPARFQLLFQHTAPGFEPSAASIPWPGAPSIDLGEVRTDRPGVEDEADLDLWTAVLTGLASQQVSNDPGGIRWLRLVDVAVGRLLFGAPTHPGS